jgi:hypothetical protein
MLKSFEDMQKYGKDNVDATMKVWGQVSKGVQAMAAETADYSKKSFEEGSAVLQKLIGAKSLENVIEIQTAYAKTAYEGFVAQATRMGEFYVNLAKETSKPFEHFVPQAPAAKPPENLIPQASAAEPTENFLAEVPTAEPTEHFVPEATAAEPTEQFASEPPTAGPTEDFVPQAPAGEPTKDFVPQASASRPTENFVPEAPAAKPTENFVPQAPIPKAATTKAPTTKPRSRNNPVATSRDSSAPDA